jgi:hypothetical protein
MEETDMNELKTADRFARSVFATLAVLVVVTMGLLFNAAFSVQVLV